jgi:hypothetical protein
MNFEDKYTTDDKDAGKKLVSNDSFLIAEMLDKLNNMLARLALK